VIIDDLELANVTCACTCNPRDNARRQKHNVATQSTPTKAKEIIVRRGTQSRFCQRQQAPGGVAFCIRAHREHTNNDDNISSRQNTKFVLQQMWVQADIEEVRVCVCQTAQSRAIARNNVFVFSFSLVYTHRAIGFLAGAKIMFENNTKPNKRNSHKTKTSVR
jgi:hypothetical protein